MIFYTDGQTYTRTYTYNMKITTFMLFGGEALNSDSGFCV